MALLLVLYRLPRLPPSFGSTNASHALLVTFRVLAAGQGPPAIANIFALLRAALIQVGAGWPWTFWGSWSRWSALDSHLFWSSCASMQCERAEEESWG